MKKSLVVYYSRTGMTKKVGDLIAKEMNADSDEIIDLKKRSGVKGWLISGRDAFKGNLTDIKTKKDPEKYFKIVIGTPVWSGRMTPAVRTYLKNHKFDNKKIHFFCTSGGGNVLSALSGLQELLKKSKVGADLSVLAKDVKSGEYKDKVIQFVEAIK